MDDIDRRLLNHIQAGIPLVARPFADVAGALRIDEDEAIARVARLKAEGIVRQISAIFDTRWLGYQSMLVAMSVDPAQVEAAAAVVNAHPGVSHNYQRDHAFNLWFTIALPPASSLERAVDRLGELAGARGVLLLPTVRLFKIGVKLDMVGEDDVAGVDELEGNGGRAEVGRDVACNVSTEGASVGARHASPLPRSGQQTFKGEGAPSLGPRDIELVRELQEDLAVEARPFLGVADRLGLAEEEVLGWAQWAAETGLMRRLAAVLNHRRAGFGANAMGVWAAPPDRLEEAGARMSTFRAVSHCYQRPTYPGWPYSLFTMIHGRAPRDCEQVAQAIAGATGITDHALLYSTREFKKVRVKFYTPGLEAWEERYL